MSFMKARQVVQTCVLSTRWRHLWRSVPCLDVDDQEFKTSGVNTASAEKEMEKFEDFTDHLLIPNNISIAHLDTFRLHVFDRYHLGKQAAKWIRHGIKYRAQVPGILQDGLTSTSWRLKRLHLSNVQLDECFAKHVSSGCHYLEDMELNGCSCRFHEIISHSLKNLVLKSCSFIGCSEIKSSTLKNLVIDDCTTVASNNLIITVPAVAYLFLSLSSYYFGGGDWFNEMPSLVKAHVHLWDNHGESVSEDQAKLLGSLSNVTSLELLGFQTMMFSEESMAFPNFRNLKSLLLDSCDLSDNFKILEHFLKHSHLEKLTLRCCKFSKDLKRRKGKAKSKAASSSQGVNLVDAECKNLKLTEIIYKDDDVRLLVELLLSISEHVPKNNIKLTKAD
ncbi:hypothetical protein PR202_gb15588 [Eleusine coracana subsp. coracana]|uniref:Uncharacterized protein n=1 Tax=Eleusine coracana subsp. coracana TaxID=191504 RepID=A0AAV5EY96_ELECO|nr:hypothetical protein PR202_gb15588 [Eleusine coracana subsp. coracana]